MNNNVKRNTFLLKPSSKLSKTLEIERDQEAVIGRGLVNGEI